ncbi:ArnT family glycosyltransferase [Tundrisphaera lichenicola]|uniref:ArnT family glycosyltransferase n=1 Tax=Tundrisphaera lichenicola TaxID=2029860 RepID=UPI003EBD780C
MGRLHDLCGDLIIIRRGTVVKDREVLVGGRIASRGLCQSGLDLAQSWADDRPGPMDLAVSDRPPPTPRRWPIRVGALAVALGTLALMIATEPRMAIAWDEGFTLGREARIRRWFRALLDPPGFASRWEPPSPRTELVQQDNPYLPPPGREQVDTRAKLFSPPVIAWFWPFAREEPHGHPPFYAIEGLIGDWIAPSWADLPRARLGPILAFALTAGAIFGFVGRRWGAWPGALAAGAWVLQPNLFGHGHYATVDGILSCLWVGALLAFARAVEREGRSPGWGWVLLFGILCGWAADSKLTGWFLPVPFLAWSLIYRDRRGWLTLLVGGLVGLLVLFAFNPGWWADPVSGVERFLRSNLTRGRTIPIEVSFLGQVYNTPRESLPWYNTLAWTVMVTPVGFLGLSLVGVVGAAVGGWRSLWAVRPLSPTLPHGGGGDQRAGAVDRIQSGRLTPSPPVGEGRGEGVSDPRTLDRFAVLVALHWAMLLALRALPHTPGHDGVRLFLPAFGMLAIVAGLGSSMVVARFGRIGKSLIVLAIAEGAASLALMMPVPLSYFSPIVGGLPGAARLGMEPTYFWDALDDDALDWLNRNTPPGRSVWFASNPTSWYYLQETGKLRVPFLTQYETRKPIWYVLQNRPGAFHPSQRELIEHGKPAYVVSKLGVPLILIYPLPD